MTTGELDTVLYSYLVIYCTVCQVSYLKDHFNWRIQYSSVQLLVIYCTVCQVSYLKDHFNWRIQYSSVQFLGDLLYSVSGELFKGSF